MVSFFGACSGKIVATMRGNGKKNLKAADEYLINWFVPIAPFWISLGAWGLSICIPFVDECSVSA